MGENNSIQHLGLFNIPIGDKKWFAEHTKHHHHHHHHHHDNDGSGVRSAETSETLQETKHDRSS